MKVFVGLLLAVAICSTVGLPARDPNSDAEFITQSPDRFKDFSGVIDTGADFPSPVNPFSEPDIEPAFGLFGNLNDYLRRFRERLLGGWWNNIPSFNIGDLDPSKGNSSSVVKVIDGHRVEINDTVYTRNDDNGNAVFKVRVVNVRPLDDNDDQTTEGQGNEIPQTTSKKDDTNDREPLDNEVYSTSENTAESMESVTTSTAPSQSEQNIPTTPSQKQTEFDEDDDDETVETVNLSDDENSNKENPFAENFAKLEFTSEDQSRPTYSDEMSSRVRLPLKPIQKPYISRLHSEFSEEDDSLATSPDQTDAERSEWDSYEDWHNNRETNNIDDFQSIPVDLSNDIEVNQMLADQGAPTNPDAEVFALPPQNYYHQRLPMREHIRPSYSWYPYQPNRFWPKRK